jgi:Flp pilus assembly protein TadD
MRLGFAAGGAAAVGVAAAVVLAITTLGGIDRWFFDRRLDHATRSLAAGDARAAARVLLPVVAERPGDPVTHYYLGLAYIRSGLPSVAIGQLSEAARLEPRDARVRGALGEALLDDGRVDEALVQLREAVRLRPASADVRVLLGLALCRAGDAAGMKQELHAAERMAAGEPLGELARQLSESGQRVCVAGHR